jgi:hypothetical protein
MLMEEVVDLLKLFFAKGMMHPLMALTLSLLGLVIYSNV